jgi:hypothetical protein
MLVLATVESLLGSIWFAFSLAALGYILGNLLPISRFIGRS